MVVGVVHAVPIALRKADARSKPAVTGGGAGLHGECGAGVLPLCACITTLRDGVRRERYVGRIHRRAAMSRVAIDVCVLSPVGRE